MRKIGWNDQRDNYDYAGKFKAWWQCFSTSAWMFLSWLTGDKIKAKDDKGLAQYLDDVEITVGKTGVAERTIARLRLKITGGSSYWWAIQQAGIKEWAAANGVNADIQFRDGTILISSLPTILKTSPVIIATKYLGGLPGGHIVLIVDYDEKSNSYIVNDPFGNAKTKYLDKNGDSVLYNAEWFSQYINVGGNKCRVIFKA
jgi:hypothetical protein